MIRPLLRLFVPLLSRHEQYFVTFCSAAQVHIPYLYPHDRFQGLDMVSFQDDQPCGWASLATPPTSFSRIHPPPSLPTTYQPLLLPHCDHYRRQHSILLPYTPFTTTQPFLADYMHIWAMRIGLTLHHHFLHLHKDFFVYISTFGNPLPLVWWGLACRFSRISLLCF